MSLTDLRSEIDSIDGQLVSLLNRRAEIAQKIGEQKSKSSAHYFTPEREQTVYGRVVDASEGPLPPSAIRAIFREIMSASRALEKPLNVAFLGPEGTFSHYAGILRFGSSSQFVTTDTIADIFVQVERGACDYGVVPVENSLSGVIPETLDTFLQSNLRVVSELFVPIHHYLASKAADLDAVKRIYSKTEPFAQCRQWLRNHLPSAEQIEVSSTARAAAMAAEDPASAAVCPRLAADLHELPILVEHVEDNPSNRTRFLVLGYNEPEPSGRDKTSITFSVHNRSGELFRAMSAFEANDVNLTMIESRPSKSANWDYVFYIDVQGHLRDHAVSRAIHQLNEQALFVRVLGSYPAAE